MDIFIFLYITLHNHTLQFTLRSIITTFAIFANVFAEVATKVFAAIRAAAVVDLREGLFEEALSEHFLTKVFQSERVLVRTLSRSYSAHNRLV